MREEDPVAAPARANPALEFPPITPLESRLLRELVYDHSGLSLADDLAYLVASRLGPRLIELGLPDFTAYYRHLRYGDRGAAELELALDALTTNETYLYRQPTQLEAFSEELLPALAREGSPGRRLRVWSAGCSTGEEVYTIAALVLRSRLFGGWDVEVLGTDIVPRVLEVARAGAYGARAFRGDGSEVIRPWFEARGGRWYAKQELRKLVRFERQNLLEGHGAGGHGPFDAIFCRNVLIYFDLRARRRAVRTFQARLRKGGYLLLGHAESLRNLEGALEVVQLSRDLVYRKPGSSA